MGAIKHDGPNGIEDFGEHEDLSKAKAVEPIPGGDPLSQVTRAARFPSHALVEVKLSRWNPFSVCSAVLLDMSVTGFKIEFIEKVDLAENSKLQVVIPLEPFRIMGGGRLTLKAEVKWFDGKLQRAGGMFVKQGDQERLLIQRIIASVITPV